MGSTCHYKNIVTSNVSLSIPEKIQSKVYKSNITYNNKKFYIQTPELDIKETDCTFKITDNPDFFNILSELDEYIIDYISDNSELFFKGRHFDKIHISNAFSPILNNKDTFSPTINSVFSESVKYSNSFGESIEPEQTNYKARCIINLDSVIFNGSMCKINIVVCNVKISIKSDKSEIQRDCILSESPILEPIDPEPVLDTDFFLD
jgi:hypothetical protein